MQCDVCGREILGKPHRVIIEGAKVVTCAECAKLGSDYWTPEREAPLTRRHISKTQKRLAIRGRESDRQISSLEDLEIAEDFGSIIKKAREKMGLTIEDLSRKIGEKESVIRKIESEKIVPDVRLAAKLEHALRVKLLTKPSRMEIEKPVEISRREKGVTLGEIVQLKSGRKGGKSGDESYNSAPQGSI